MKDAGTTTILPDFDKDKLLRQLKEFLDSVGLSDFEVVSDNEIKVETNEPNLLSGLLDFQFMQRKSKKKVRKNEAKED